jgi:hypothetical protein
VPATSVRLAGTGTESAGRILVWRSGMWAAISAPSAVNATQIGATACASLGYERSIVDPHSSYWDPAVSPQWSGVDCTGQDSLLECGYGSWTSGTDELGVECFSSSGKFCLPVWLPACVAGCLRSTRYLLIHAPPVWTVKWVPSLSTSL